MKTLKMWSLFTYDKEKEKSFKKIEFMCAKILEMYSDFCCVLCMYVIYGFIGDFWHPDYE